MQLTQVWQSLEAAGDCQARRRPSELCLQNYPAKLRCLERLTVAYIDRALYELDVSGHKILPAYRKLVSRWRNRLLRKGPLEAPLYSLWAETRARWPRAPLFLRYLRRCGENLTASLTGRVNPLYLLFPGGSFETAEYFYEHSPAARYFNGIAGAILGSAAKQLPHEPQLRILEIGAGVGGAASVLLPVLPSSRTIYCYSDCSNLFLAKAKQKFKAYPFVRYGLLNIERNPLEQGYALKSFNAIVAVNVLHATRNLRETLRHVKSLLIPGGLLLLREATSEQSWFDISFALIEGWQRHEDKLRRDGPLLALKQWHKALRSAGFVKVAVFPKIGSAADALGQHVLMCA